MATKLKNKAAIIAILEAARVECEKLQGLSIDEENTYEEANEYQQSKMDDNEVSSFLRDSPEDFELAMDALQNVIDGLAD